MSQHADLTKHCLAFAIKADLSFEGALDNLNGTLLAAGYEYDYLCQPHELHQWIKEMLLSQRDELHGVSHWQIKDWIRRRNDD